MAVGAHRRLARVAASLGPTELVLRWLAEAQAYDSFEAYSGAVYAQGPDALPLDRLVREAHDTAKSESRGRSMADADEARRTAMRQTIFLFHLVLGTIVLARAALDREALLHALFGAHLAIIASGAGPDGPAAVSSHESRLAMLRDAVTARVTELQAMAAARAQVEARYLGGQPALFPATVRRWAEQLDRTEQLAALAIRLAELDGLAPSPAPDPDAFAARVEQLVADHVEPARVRALDEMDEGYRAVSIAMRWLQPKLG